MVRIGVLPQSSAERFRQISTRSSPNPPAPFCARQEIVTCLSCATEAGLTLKLKIFGGTVSVQGLVLQCCVASLDPLQSDPPFPGAGLLQVRVLVCVPVPQVSEQAFHALQSDHLPLIWHELLLVLQPSVQLKAPIQVIFPPQPLSKLLLPQNPAKLVQVSGTHSFFTSILKYAGVIP